MYDLKLNSQNVRDGSYYLITRLFAKYIKPQIKTLLSSILCMFVVALTTAVNVWLMQPILDQVFVQKKHVMLFVVPIAVIVNSIIKGAAAFYQTAGMKKVGQDVITDIQMQLYKHLIYADVTFFHNNPPGKLISRFTNDINTIRKSISDVFTTAIGEVITLLGLVCIMFYQNAKLAVTAFFVFPLTFFVIIKLGRKMRNLAHGVQEQLGWFTVRLDETFQNMGVIKSYCREEYEIARARKVLDKMKFIYRKSIFVESISPPLMETLGGAAVALVILYGGMEVMSDHITPGAFFSFIVALFMTYRPLRAISTLHHAIQEGSVSIKRIFKMLDAQCEIRDTETSKDVRYFKNYDIAFKNVSFSYENEKSVHDEKKILNNLNIYIPQGKTVALVGSSGVGKTTVLNLLQRFYDPDDGTITIGSVDIRTIKLHCLRHTIALVSQDADLFDDTIAENIRYGKLDATEEDVQTAANAAAAHDFIILFKEGYNTRIGKHGEKLSGGQKQRIAIARAILKNASILLLDEATSALDSVSEKQVQQALENLKKGRTTVVIAHRLSTIEAADIIYLVSEGRALESGTHHELLQKNREYANLYEQYKGHRID
ncbi:ATP-dependent lipid A-core flippase [Alphaproteobacteria bacterium]